MTATIGRRDIAPLPLRLGALFVMRLLLATSVLAATVLVPQTARSASAVTVVAGYLLASVALEVARQLSGGLRRAWVGAAVLIDGVFVATAVTLSGGPGGALGFLLYVHLVTVTLLMSYRTGLKAAVWQSVLLVVAYHLPASVTHNPPMDLSSTVLAIVAFLGVSVTTAACSSLNERELRRSRSGFRALADMAHRMQDVRDVAELADVLLAAVPHVMPCGRAAVYLHAERTVTVTADGGVVSAQAGDTPDAVVAHACDTAAPVLARRLQPHGNPALTAALPKARNVVVVPLVAEREAAGALVVERGGHAGTRIGRSAVTLLGQLAAHAAVVHRNLRLLGELEHRASVDPLTGLANRRTFADALRREVARADRSGEPLSVLLLDIDHFKAVNDEHGHQMGDDVLRHVGRVLRERGREVDVAARYGGEEFAVVLPACPADEAVVVAERLRAGISAPAAPLPVTASVGVACLGGEVADGDSLVAAADAALYRAKDAGRDRVVAAPRALRAVV